MFKALIIAYYFPPMGLSGVQRTLKFAKYMSKYNWQPTVITTNKVAYYAHDKSLSKEAEEANIRIIRTKGKDINSMLAGAGTVKMPAEGIRKFFSRVSKIISIPDNKKSWAKQAYKTAQTLLREEKFDVIFVSMPPFSPFPFAAKLKSEFNIPLFVDYRDLWYGNQFSIYPTFYHKYKHKRLESTALIEADKVVVVNRRIKEKLLLTYPFLTFDEIIIIPHGYDQEDFDKTPAIPKENKKMKLLYSGIFYETITPQYLLHAFKKLTLDRPDVAQNIELHFAGILGKRNKKLIKYLGLTHFVREHGYLNHDESVKLLKTADILWMMIGHSKNSDTISTGKLFEYFGSRKPILACVPEGAAKMAAEEYGASFITNPDSISQIFDKIIEINELYKANKLPQVNEEFVLKHDRDKLTEQLIRHFQFFLKADV